MGPILSKPVTTKVLERKRTTLFHVGIGYMNGFREKMEDAHAVHVKDDHGFFGVFDGHCGPLCSEYIARRFPEEINKLQVPIKDEVLSKLSLDLDQEFLDTQLEGGSTGTFIMAQKVEETYLLQVGNVGDSRVVLGRRKTKEPVSMTTDHKPSDPEESARIREAGGTVSNNRVDGSLAVSRAFGDASYKNLSNVNSKVIALPEITHFKAEVGDIVLLCCDGVFESDAFSNEGVIEFIFERLEKKMDLASIAAAVCDEAMYRGSKDNISAMILQLGGELDNKEELPEREIYAGPFSSAADKFVAAYDAMAQDAGLLPVQMVELRYDQVKQRLAARKAATTCTDTTCDFTTLEPAEMHKILCKHGPFADEDVSSRSKEEYVECLKQTAASDATKDLRPVDVVEMVHELEDFSVPSDIDAMEQFSEDRTKFFSEWVQAKKTAPAGANSDDLMSKAMELHQKVGLPYNLIMNILEQQGV